MNVCVFNRATVSETALKIDRVVYGSLVVGDELSGKFSTTREPREISSLVKWHLFWGMVHPI